MYRDESDIHPGHTRKPHTHEHNDSDDDKMASDNYGLSDATANHLMQLASTDDRKRAVTCVINNSTNEYNSSVGIRVSAIFVVLIVSTACTAFPVIATRLKKVRIPLYVYLFARYFGAGVIVATAFIQ